MCPRAPAIPPSPPPPPTCAAAGIISETVMEMVMTSTLEETLPLPPPIQKHKDTHTSKQPDEHTHAHEQKAPPPTRFLSLHLRFKRAACRGSVSQGDADDCNYVDEDDDRWTSSRRRRIAPSSQESSAWCPPSLVLPTPLHVSVSVYLCVVLCCSCLLMSVSQSGYIPSSVVDYR